MLGKLHAPEIDSGEGLWMLPFVEGHMGRHDGKDSRTTSDASAPSWPNGPDGKKVEALNYGGGAPWQSASYDPEINTPVAGAGNPAPLNTCVRSPGDSLYTSGQAYVNSGNGELIGFYQHTPNDAWDFSGNNEIILFDYKDKNGKDHRAGAHADRNGFF